MVQNVIVPPRGFRAAACSSGIKRSGKADLALIAAERPVACAGLFTTNKVVAAPVLITAERVHKGICQAILVNSGNANACTGEVGLTDARRCGELAAQALKIETDLVAVASTGVIGVPLPMSAFEQHVPNLALQLDDGKFLDVARAMMTTDAFEKVCSRTLKIDNKECRILGLAKGAGMIHPNMATMLAFVLTDAAIEKKCLESILRTSVDLSFNRVTVDRDTSTNDMTLIMASGLAGNRTLTDNHPDFATFSRALNDLLLELAKMMVQDGEGATKLVKIQVVGAKTDRQALTVAQTVATSQLVKTAFFGEDANWGRIIAAVGYSGVEIEPSLIDIQFDEVPVVTNGVGMGSEVEAKATEVMKKAEFTVTIDLHIKDGTGYYYTSDLGYNYVRINADYRT
jgi:glutamate N-acetyltransferase/amino-acid N-acetyltransferase